MADMNALSGNPIASLYPQPQSPSQIIGTYSSILQAQNQQKTLAAQQAQGNALQGAIGPNGFDPDAYAQAIKNDPNAAYGMNPASLLQQRGMQIDNATKGFGLMAGQNDQLRQTIAALSSNPNATKDDYLNAIPSLVRMGVPPDMAANYAAGLSSDPKVFHTQAANMANMVMGPANAATRVSGAPTASGAKTTLPLGTAAIGGGYATELPPGQPEAIAQNQKDYVSDQQRSSATMANVRQLQTALPLISQLGNASFGPGSPEFAKLRGALTMAGVINPNTSDLQVRQEASKYLSKYAQGAINANRSDAALSAAFNANPNMDLTQPANLSLVKNQIAMDRMDAALPMAFSAAHPNESDKGKYNDFKSNYYQTTDQRAFGFDNMSPEERGQLVASLGPKNSAAYQKFAKSYALAKKTQMVTPQAAPDQQPQAAQQ